MKVKTFFQSEKFRLKFEDALNDLEVEVDQWGSNNPNAEILDIKQSFSAGIGPRQVVFSIWYK